jgi:hypothetical protein
MEAQIQSFIILLFNDFLLHYKFKLLSRFWPVNYNKNEVISKKTWYPIKYKWFDFRLKIILFTEKYFWPESVGFYLIDH